MKARHPRIAIASVLGLLIAAPPLLCLPWFSHGNVVIPFRTIHGLIIATMSLNGKPGENFVIDTGAFTTVLNASAVAARGLKTHPLHGTVHCFGGDISISQAAPQATIFGYGLRITGGGIVSDLNPLQGALHLPLFGIIGSDTMTSQPILVDYKAGRITVFLRNRMPHLAKDAERIPLESPPPGADNFPGPVIAAQVQLPDGKLVRASLEIDTGNDTGLILYAPFAAKYGLLDSTPDPKSTVLDHGCGGQFALAPTALPAILLGNQKIANPKTLSAEKAVGAAANTAIDGSIGYPILSRFRVFIDAPQHYVVFEPVKGN